MALIQKLQFQANKCEWVGVFWKADVLVFRIWVVVDCPSKNNTDSWARGVWLATLNVQTCWFNMCHLHFTNYFVLPYIKKVYKRFTTARTKILRRNAWSYHWKNITDTTSLTFDAEDKYTSRAQLERLFHTDHTYNG